jgi:hypothetical protein
MSAAWLGEWTAMVEEPLGDQEKDLARIRAGDQSGSYCGLSHEESEAYCVDVIAEYRAELDGLRRALSKLWEGSPMVRALTGEAVMVEVCELLKSRLPDLSEHDPVRVALTRVIPEIEAVA